MRPFYKWNEGFFDNYLKYCGPESINRRAKRVKMTFKEQQEEERLIRERKKSMPDNDKSYLKGYFDRKSIQSSQELQIVPEDNYLDSTYESVESLKNQE